MPCDPLKPAMPFPEKLATLANEALREVELLKSKLAVLQAELSAAKEAARYDMADCDRAQKMMASAPWARLGHTYLDIALDRIEELNMHLATAGKERDEARAELDKVRAQYNHLANGRDSHAQCRETLAKVTDELAALKARKVDIGPIPYPYEYDYVEKYIFGLGVDACKKAIRSAGWEVEP